MEETYLNTVFEITGVLNEMLGQQLIQQAVEATPQAKKIDVKAETVSAALGEMRPKDAIEGMIVTQKSESIFQDFLYQKKKLKLHGCPLSGT